MKIPAAKRNELPPQTLTRMNATLTLPDALPVIFKSMALLAFAAIVVCVLMRRMSASARHFAWVVAAAGVLILPLCSAVLPSWNVLPKWAAAAEPSSAGTIDRLEIADDPVRIETARQSTIAQANPSLPVVTDSSSGMTSGNWIASIWLMGVGLLIFRLVLSQLCLIRASRQAEPISGDSDLAAEIESIRKESGIHRRIRVRVSNTGRGTVPMTWGIFRPVLQVPRDMVRWESSRRRSVLLHELAHIRRWDAATHLFVQIVCALHWFNPLVWLVARQIYLERERACDDFVLQDGSVRPSEYASHLLRILADLDVPRYGAATGAVAMAAPGRSRLEERLRMITADAVDRRPVSLNRSLGVLAAAGLLILPIAMLQAETEKTSGGGENDKSSDSGPKEKNRADDIVFENLGVEIADERAGLSWWLQNGFAAGDFDKDGYLDLLLTNRLDDPGNKADPLVGIGIQVDSTENEGFRVLGLLPGGPAEKGGELKPGDRIVGVAQGADGKMVDVRALDLVSLVKLIRGNSGSEVRLQVASDEKTEREIRIERAEITLQSDPADAKIADYYDQAFQAQTAIGALRDDLSKQVKEFEETIRHRLDELEKFQVRFAEKHAELLPRDVEIKQLKEADCAQCHTATSAGLRFLLNRGDGTFEDLGMSFSDFFKTHPPAVKEEKTKGDPKSEKENGEEEKD